MALFLVILLFRDFRGALVAKDAAGAVRWSWVADIANGVLQDAAINQMTNGAPAP